MSAGSRYAREQAHPMLEGAASLVQLVIEEISRTAEKDAGSVKASWASSLAFICRGLNGAADHAYDWLFNEWKIEARREPPAPPPRPGE